MILRAMGAPEVYGTGARPSISGARAGPLRRLSPSSPIHERGRALKFGLLNGS
ncbi:hypothetical protein SAM23877_3102 [Streptomyces ambofaciens ATCC 23877]|uniref:Uncharacterized protein n=1 Tax=Streptomyces ambofaciens (strain ATCC 23877 / 3486 / DSM 40053 / JCM 4204 / NBRC 12836 / NRRL B-2516) TaxID=278992 RepID=A0A0K2AT93_STRA7|nr:hypothetical protein SAM23877_3102 [Streptomyces ambofaciens ATCC 23877]